MPGKGKGKGKGMPGEKGGKGKGKGKGGRGEPVDPNAPKMRQLHWDSVSDIKISNSNSIFNDLQEVIFLGVRG